MKEEVSKEIVSIYSEKIFPALSELIKLAESGGMEDSEIESLKIECGRVLYDVYENILGNYVFKKYPKLDKTGRDWP